MSTLVVGRSYRVTAGAWTENGVPQPTPWRLTMLDRKKVTVIEAGLLLDHDIPAVRVQAKKVHWDRLVEVTLTNDQRRELGVETDSNTVYRMAGRVWSNQPGDDLKHDIGQQVEFPQSDEQVIPASWLDANAAYLATDPQPGRGVSGQGSPT